MRAAFLVRMFSDCAALAVLRRRDSVREGALWFPAMPPIVPHRRGQRDKGREGLERSGEAVAKTRALGGGVVEAAHDWFGVVRGRCVEEDVRRIEQLSAARSASRPPQQPYRRTRPRRPRRARRTW